jgi:TetR/AcrR family transcriptional regulator, regulator of cefoperazone and chloramphenicol sensitivity
MKRIDTKRKRPATGRAKVAASRNGNGPRNGTRPKRIRDRAAKKQALVLAALGLFASKGYEVTTTREIAAAAGCAEGLIHRYFKGKAGLLAALIECRTSREVPDVGHQLQPAPKLEDEFLQLVDREVDGVWENRDFFRVFIPRAIVDPSVGSTLNKALISARIKAISERLKHCESSTTLQQNAIEALAQVVGMLGFAFGFVRPVLLGQDHLRAKKMATTVARMFVDGSANSLVA